MPNMFSQTSMPSLKTVVSTAASLAASAMVIRSIARDLLPYELQLYVLSSIQTFLRSCSSDIILIIEEFDGLVGNQIYRAADTYLGTKICPSTKMFKVSMPEKEHKVRTSMTGNQEIIDKFNGMNFKWRQVSRQVESKLAVFPNQSSSATQTEVRCFHLSFHKKHRDMVFNSYFPYILKQAKSLKQENKTLKIFTLNSDHMLRYSGVDYVWNSINLDHPATFDTLAMDADLKKMIVDDLEMFVKRKDFYRNVGKAWKRGYLLYGPPGTGKSSLIAAMANFLNFDIYDLELTDIHANSELRRLLIATANRSIIVVEDIDCSLDLEDRGVDARVMNALRSANLNQASTVNIVHKPKHNRVTLSGLLNFIDGLWSSCGDERIIVFTTNHKDRLDEALLRPGRMDVHIHMSYCTPSGFRILCANYLGISDHSLFPEINELLAKASVTPAEVGEQLLKNADPEVALAGLIGFIEKKKRESEHTQLARSVEEQEGDGIQNEVQQAARQTTMVHELGKANV